MVVSATLEGATSIDINYYGALCNGMLSLENSQYSTRTRDGEVREATYHGRTNRKANGPPYKCEWTRAQSLVRVPYRRP